MPKKPTDIFQIGISIRYDNPELHVGSSFTKRVTIKVIVNDNAKEYINSV